VTTNDATNQPAADDLKQSFAWGQLFAGSVIGGLAVWKLLHKMTSTEPSVWFAGLARAYEEVRDFLMTPFEWIQLDLTADEKNVLVICVVLVGALVRALTGFPALARSFINAVGFAFVFVILIYGIRLLIKTLPGVEGGNQIGVLEAIAMDLRAEDIRPPIVLFAFVAIFVSLFTPIVNLLSRRVLVGPAVAAAPVHSLILLNLLFTAAWGCALLLLNWATS